MPLNATEPRFELGFADGVAGALYRRLYGDASQDFLWKNFANDWSPALRAGAGLAYVRLSFNEYCSAALAAQHAQVLVHANAPLDLCALACHFPGQELRHAELFGRVGELLAVDASVKGRTEHATYYPQEGLDPLQRANEVVVRTMVCETISASLLSASRRVVTTPLLRAIYTSVVRDEMLHARFGLLYLDWIRPALDAVERARLSGVVRETLTSYRSQWHKSVGSPEPFTDRERALAGLMARGQTALRGEQSIARVLVPRLARYGITVD